MSEPSIPLGSNKDHPILIEDNDHLQQEPQRDGSEADTIRIDTPEYEQWSNGNFSTMQPNESFIRSTPSASLNYKCNGVSQTPALLAEEESEKVEFQQGMLITHSISGEEPY